jgi:HK97 gp10 family phage protein
MSNHTHVVDKGYAKIIAELKAAAKLEVAVGVHEGAENSESGASIAEYGAFNEFGTDSGTPERPFMRTAFDENQSQIKSDCERQINAVATGKRTARQALTVIGQKHADRIKAVIRGRNFLPRLARSTVAAKKGSTKTLVDTGALIDAVHPVVRGES